MLLRCCKSVASRAHLSWNTLKTQGQAASLAPKSLCYSVVGRAHLSSTAGEIPAIRFKAPESVKFQQPAVELPLTENAVRRNIRSSPRKLNLVAKQVRGLGLKEAIVQMRFSRKTAARQVEAVLYNSMHAANHNQGLDASNLYVAKAWVGKAKYLKRIRYHARGRGARMRKYFSHLFVELKEGQPPKKERTTRMQRKAMKIANSRKPERIYNSL